MNCRHERDEADDDAYNPAVGAARPMMDVEQVRNEVLTHLNSLKDEMRRGFDGLAKRYDTDADRVGVLERHQAADYVRVQKLEERTGKLEDSRTKAFEDVLSLLASQASRVNQIDGRIGSLEVNGPVESPRRSRKEQTVLLSLGGTVGAGLVKLIELIGKSVGQ